MGKGWFVVEKTRRCARTVFFMVAMVTSLLVSSLPMLVAIGDVLVPSFLLSSFTCLTCYSVREHLHRYGLKSSLTDIPLVSVVRSFLVICIYSLSDGPALSHGPYLGAVSLCSVVSILLLSVKACVFTVHSQLEAEASLSLSRKRLHLKKSWGMPVLFLSSVVFALGHTVVAYRTSCRARRKLLYHRVDPEAVLACKSVFSGFQKAPRSPTPSAGKASKIDTDSRWKPLSATHDEGEVPVRLLADLDSLFITIRGLTVHYKLCLPGLPIQSISSTSSHEVNCKYNTLDTMALEGRLKPDRKESSMSTRTQHHHLHRSYSSQFSNSSLHAPLLDGSLPSPHMSKEIQDGMSLDNDMMLSNCGAVEQGWDGNGQFGIVLVHGFGGGVFSWRHVMGSLAHQLGCAVAAFDRPGWGLTARLYKKDWEERELPNPYTLESQVDLLLSFCHEMGFSSVVLVGHDDGGLLAMKAAQRIQTSNSAIKVAVKGVVLLNVSLSREVVPAFARILLRTSLGKKHLVRPLLRTEIAQVVNRRAWYDANKLTTEVLRLYKAPLHVEGWDEALHEIGRLSYEMVLLPQNATSLLESMEELPVLVIAGAEDALVPLKSSQAMASKLLNSRLVSISGCGHLPHEECPKTLLAAMSPFIKRLALRQDLQGRKGNLVPS
ncbi:PREDICTED: uncharacterized protein LOC104808220 [Tarenaya hassleriana]|uniref:uncharacterized protein LOC104808220 n=1 Tax=Tarenaya hassleriana TaxID=28532 RepID=UPI00053C8011|nr:PREDICTED: uncharacterized protein LOC104808220 [Tarenaya hassleriana]